MKTSDYLVRIRELLHDPDGRVWQDDELLDMIDDAAEQYCSDTGMYCGCFNVSVDNDGRAAVPEQYLSFMAGWNDENMPVICVSADEAARNFGNFLSVRGHAKYVYEDLDSIGYLRFCPNPIDIQGGESYVPAEPFGIFKLPAFGIPVMPEYGIPVKMGAGVSCAQIQYIRKEEVEKIHDHLAVIYRTLYQALTMDGDFQNLSLADTYFSQYQTRVALAGKQKYVTSTIRRGGRFF